MNCDPLVFLMVEMLLVIIYIFNNQAAGHFIFPVKVSTRLNNKLFIWNLLIFVIVDSPWWRRCTNLAHILLVVSNKILAFRRIILSVEAFLSHLLFICIRGMFKEIKIGSGLALLVTTTIQKVFHFHSIMIQIFKLITVI